MRGITTATFISALALCGALAGNSAAATSDAVVPAATNGAWVGRTDQALPASVTVRNHVVVDFTARLKFKPYNGAPASACPDLTISARLVNKNAPSRTNRKRFWIVEGPEWTMNGTIRSDRSITGAIDYTGYQGSDPCEADVTFTLHPRDSHTRAH